MFLVECNLSENAIVKKKKRTPCELILSNYRDESDMLRPYEANLYRVIGMDKASGKQGKQSWKQGGSEYN